MRRVRKPALRAAAVAMLAATSVVSAPASALANSRPHAPENATTAHVINDAPARSSALTLVLFSPDGHRLATAGLNCDPDAGSIADPKLACGELRAVDGNFAKLWPDRQVLCANHVDPVAAVAVGRWRGCLVAWASRVFPNLCELQRRTGSVFRF